MNELRQFVRQIRAYRDRTERGNAVAELHKRSYKRYVSLEQLEKKRRLTDRQRRRWRRIKADCKAELPEMFGETV